MRLLKLNSEAELNTGSALGVSGIPALILFQDGVEVGRKAGLMSAEQIVNWTQQVIGS